MLARPAGLRGCPRAATTERRPARPLQAAAQTGYPGGAFHASADDLDFPWRVRPRHDRRDQAYTHLGLARGHQRIGLGWGMTTTCPRAAKGCTRSTQRRQARHRDRPVETRVLIGGRPAATTRLLAAPEVTESSAQRREGPRASQSHQPSGRQPPPTPPPPPPLPGPLGGRYTNRVHELHRPTLTRSGGARSSRWAGGGRAAGEPDPNTGRIQRNCSSNPNSSSRINPGRPARWVGGWFFTYLLQGNQH